MPQTNSSGQTGIGNEAMEEALAPHSSSDIPPDQRAQDPICGSTVDMRTALFTTNYSVNGGSLRTFYFDSDECKQLFERNPEQYVKPA